MNDEQFPQTHLPMIEVTSICCFGKLIVTMEYNNNQQNQMNITSDLQFPLHIML